MKIIASTLLLCLFGVFCSAQIFTKVTTGPVVTDSSNNSNAHWGDYDGDGDLDLLVTTFNASLQNPNSNNFLYQNNCNGQFTKIVAQPGGIVTDGGASLTSSWIDFDNDGDLDLFVGNFNQDRFLYVNNGDGTFTRIITGILITDQTFLISSSWADFDDDGFADVAIPNNGGIFQNNSLYRNAGDGSFIKITTGPVVTDGGLSKEVIWWDYDNDGDMDMYVVNRAATPVQRRNFLYRNDGGGSFTKLTTGVGPIVTDDGNSFGAEAVDFDNDLDIDMLVVNRDRAGLGNHDFYRNNGNGTFTFINPGGIFSTGVLNNGGSAWGDFDNDGDQDLFLCNFGTNLLFQNNGNGTFTSITTEIVTNDVAVESIGANWADFDNDGDLDLFVANDFNFGGPDDYLYTNAGNVNHFLNVELTGVTTNRSAVGARIFAFTTIFGSPVSQLREVNANSQGKNPFRQHFGFGDATTIDSLIVVWPTSGTVQKFFNVPVDQFIEIREDNNSILAVVPCQPDLPPVNPAFITGAVISDSIGLNCAFDVGEIAVSGRLIRAVDQDNQSFFTFSGEDGTYTFEVPKDTHTVTIVPDPPLTQESVSCGVGGLIHTVDATAGGTFSGNDFFLQQACGATVTIINLPNYPCTPPTCPLLADTTCCDTINGISNRSGPCIGCDTEYCFDFENTGTVTIMNPEFEINLDANGAFSNPVVTTNTCGTTILTNVGNQMFTFTGGPDLLPITPVCRICIQVQVDACDAAIGNLTTTAQLNSFSGACQGNPVAGAFDSMTEPDCTCPCDPNDKMTRPEGCGPFGNIAQGEELHYKVRFQNLGGSPAIDVLIRDEFDEDLDITTLKIIDASDSITSVEVIPDNALIIRFDSINLPDSISDPAGSLGFVIFSIQPKNNLPDGTEIINQAGIYFDQNDVVLTNTVLNTVRDEPFPIADFEGNHSCTSTGRVFDFTYTGGTSDSVMFDWDFGPNATPQTSTDENPTGITFSSTGSEQIKLTVTQSGGGCVDTITKTLEVEDVSCGNNKVLVCHIPPGNEDNPQTICVSESSLAAHLAHGDCIGNCNIPLAKMGGETEEGEDEETKAEIFQYKDALQAYPNPFKDMTTLTFEVARTGRTVLDVYDYAGKKVSELFDKHAVTGHEYSLEYNTSNLSNGIYYAVLQTNEGSQVTKLVLTR